MILPWPRGIIRFAASRPMTKALVRFVSMTRCHSAVASSTMGLRSWMPALLTRISTLVPASSSRAKAAGDRRFVGHVKGEFLHGVSGLAQR